MNKPECFGNVDVIDTATESECDKCQVQQTCWIEAHYSPVSSTPMTDPDLALQEILLHFGKDSQIERAIEECSELIQALQHFKRGRDNDVIGEIADVLITVGQMRLLFGATQVDHQKDMKLRRTKRTYSI